MKEYSANIDGFRTTQPPAVSSSGNGPACDDSNFWKPSSDPKENTIDEIEKGFGRK